MSLPREVEVVAIGGRRTTVTFNWFDRLCERLGLACYICGHAHPSHWDSQNRTCLRCPGAYCQTNAVGERLWNEKLAKLRARYPVLTKLVVVALIVYVGFLAGVVLLSMGVP